MMDSRGQISFEYLMIFAISLIVLTVFTMPLINTAVSDTLDVSDSIDVKSDLSKIAGCVKEVYGQGQGSKQQITLHESRNIKLTVAKDHVSCNLKLNDKTKKILRQNYESNLERTDITLQKGENSLTVEWPVGSENMIVYKN